MWGDGCYGASTQAGGGGSLCPIEAGGQCPKPCPGLGGREGVCMGAGLQMQMPTGLGVRGLPAEAGGGARPTG